MSDRIHVVVVELFERFVEEVIHNRNSQKCSFFNSTSLSGDSNIQPKGDYIAT